MEKLVLSLLASSLTMTAVAFVYMLILKILKKHWSAKWRYYTWVLIFAGFLTPFKPSFGTAAVNFDTELQAVGIGDAGHYVLPEESFDIFRMMFIVWAVGAVLFAVKALTNQQMFVKSVKRLSKPADAKTKELINELTDSLLIWQEVKAVTLNEISSPMIVGFFSPTIILPQRKYAEEELRLILKHELIHFKSRDLFVKAFMLIAQAINWFNPFFGLFVRNAEQQCEMYCDERVMKDETDENKRLYCQSILNAASEEANPELQLKPVLSSNFNISREGLKQRLQTILSVKKKYRLGIISCAVAVMIAMSGTIFAFSENNYYGDDNLQIADTSSIDWDYSFSGNGTQAVSAAEEAVATTTFVTAITLTDVDYTAVNQQIPD